MKYFYILLLMLSSCWTPPDFPMETITHTDAQGNYIGNIDPEDWVVSDFTPSQLLDIESFTINGNGCEEVFIEKMKFTETDVKPIVKIFPNPAQSGQEVSIQISYDKKMSYIVYQLTHQHFFVCAGAGTITDSSNGLYKTKVPYSTFPGDFDTEIVLAFIASDSSTFITKGDIKIIND